MKNISITEGEAIPLKGGLDSLAYRESLLRLSDALPFKAFERSGKFIRASEGVGILKHGSTTIEILPKCGRSTNAIEDREFLLNLIRVSGYLPHFHSSFGHSASTKSGFLEVLMHEVARDILDNLREGVPRQYNEIYKVSETIRGKIDIGKLAKRLPCNGHKVPITYNLLSEDNALSRLVKWTAEKLFESTRSAKNRELLAFALSCMRAVDISSYRARDVIGLSLSKYEMKWSQLYGIARILALSESPNPSATGEHSSFNLLLPLNKLFEFSLRNILTSCFLGDDVTSRSVTDQHHLLKNTVTGGKVLRLKPDLIFDYENSPIAIGDAKWKRLNQTGGTNGITPADFYQLVTYMDVYRVDIGILFFPKSEWMNSVEESTWVKKYELSGSMKKLYVFGIDLPALVSNRSSTKIDAIKDLSRQLTSVLDGRLTDKAAVQ